MPRFFCSTIKVILSLFLTFIFTLNCKAQNYCSSEGLITQYEWIEKVQVVNFQNTSGNNDGYADFSNQLIILSQLQTPTIKLTPGIGVDNFEPLEYWRVWIDYNQDGDFNEPDELVFDSNGSFEGEVQGQFTVPYFAKPDTTRMRVAMKFVNPTNPDLPLACGGFTFGEVEDYSVKIIDTVIPVDTTNTNTELIDIPKLSLFPNPASNVINWNLMNGAILKNINIFDTQGKIVLHSFANSNSLDIGSLSAGTYFLKANFNGIELIERFVVVR